MPILSVRLGTKLLHIHRTEDEGKDFVVGVVVLFFCCFICSCLNNGIQRKVHISNNGHPFLCGWSQWLFLALSLSLTLWVWNLYRGPTTTTTNNIFKKRKKIALLWENVCHFYLSAIQLLYSVSSSISISNSSSYSMHSFRF